MFENGNAHELKTCLACGSDDLNLILDLHQQPLANSYKLAKDEAQESFPLAINHCKNCHHVQLTHAVNPDLMFKDYLYVSGTSKTMDEHFEWFANYALEYHDIHSSFADAQSVLDIGCNDGSQLNHFKKLGIKTFGVDPAENLYPISSKDHTIYCDYFDESFAEMHDRHHDIIIAQNVFAHNYDPLAFLKTASRLMYSDTLMFIQTSQADMIKNNEFDTIYHEHISFYNINSMNELCKRAGLSLIDVTKCPLHGNSYIFVIALDALRPANVANLVDMERKAGLLTDSTYIEYAEKCKSIVSVLSETLKTAKNDGYKLVGYGAAAKGMTLLNYGNIRLDYIIDDNPLKQNRYTPGISTPIVSSSVLSDIDSNDKVLFIPLAWNFFKEIREKIESKRKSENDKFISYFPKVELF